MSDRALGTARAFARALDEEDYAAAHRLLSPTCVYRYQDATFQGPDAIVAEYRKNGDAVAELFDAIAYESDVERATESQAVITFVDRIRHGAYELVHTCEQHVTLDDEGLIKKIEHRDLPGEQEALDAFYRVTGLAGGDA